MAWTQARAGEPVYRSPNHVCVSPDGLRAYVVNEGADSVSVIDVRGRKVVYEIHVGSHPVHAAVSPDGRRLYVTSLYGSSVDVVDVEGKRVLNSVRTGFEPYGVTVSRDGRALYVANEISNTVSVIDLVEGKVVREVRVPRAPRFVAETPDGARLMVSHGLTRGISLVDLKSGRVTEERALGRASILRQAAVSRDGRWGFVAHLVSHDEAVTTQIERGWIHSNGFTVVDLRRPGHYVTLLLDKLTAGAANPWGLALSGDGRTLYVTLSGVHEVALVDVEKALRLVAETRPEEVETLAKDVEIVERRGIAVRVPAGGIGPRGVALSRATQELLVANYFSDTVSVLDAATGDLKAVIPLGPPQEMTLWRKGESLFNDARICFQGWFSCASCHQEDATVDGLNWDLLNDGAGNPKNAKSLHDARDTPPAMWSGVRENMEAAIAAGQRFEGALPVPENQAALEAYIGNPRRAPNPYRTRDPEAVRRGETVFARARCAECHPAPLYTDLKKHDLGLGTRTDMLSRFDTPSLRECYRTAPYLHDGRAQTLEDVFKVHNPDDLHGRLGALSEQDFADLMEYVRSL